MTRGTYVYRNGKIVPKHSAAPKHSPRINGVISDSLGEHLEHHGYSDGRRTDSKSVFRRWTKEIGAVEKGNDREQRTPVRDNSMTRDVALAVEMVKNGYKPNIQRE